MDAGGFDVECVEKPTDRWKCAICHLVLRTPCEALCCHNFLCKCCVEEYQRKGFKECPYCRSQDLECGEAIAVGRIVSQEKVYCTHRDKGCVWTGELGEHDKHLNLSPSNANLETGCDFAKIECPVCHECFERRNLSQHKLDECPNEEIACIYENNGCNWRGQRKTIEGHLLLEQRYEGCDCVMLQCIHDCGELKERRLLKQHEEDCLKRVVKCEFSFVGCQAEFLRQDTQHHLSDCKDDHMRLLCRAIKSLTDSTLEVKTLSATVKDLSADVAVVESRVDNLQVNLGGDFDAGKHECEQRFQWLKHQTSESLDRVMKVIYLVGGSIIVVIVAVLLAFYFGFNSQTISCNCTNATGASGLNSKPPFNRKFQPVTREPSDVLPQDYFVNEYSKYVSGKHSNGTSSTFVPSESVSPTNFLFALFFFKNNSKHVLTLCFYKRNDYLYEYKLATVFVQLVNQKFKSHRHHVRPFELAFPASESTEVRGGCNDFIDHVEPHFKNKLEDRLHIRVLSMELNNNMNPPYAFSLCQYSDYPSSHKKWTSNPFLSRPGGFKFTLEVYPDGYGHGQDTHLSFIIVTDENDLAPFEGKITVYFQTNTIKKIKHTVEFKGEDEKSVEKFLSREYVTSHLVNFDCILLGISNIIDSSN